MDSINILSGLFLFSLATIAEGEPIYKWVDEHGVTHYSAATPNGKKTQQLKTQLSQPVVEGSTQQPSMRDWQTNESLKNFKEKREHQKAVEDQQKAEKERRCVIARQRLGVLQQQIRLFRTNGKGEKEYWDDEARDEEIKKMNKEVESNC